MMAIPPNNSTDCLKCGYPLSFDYAGGGYVCKNRDCPSTRVEAAPVTQSPAPPETNQIPPGISFKPPLAPQLTRLDDRTLLAIMSAILDKPEHPLNWATDRAQDLLNEVNKRAQ